MIDKTARVCLTDAGDFWIVNWRLTLWFGRPDESIVLAYLSSMEDYWRQHDGLDADGFFYCTVDKMYSQTTIEGRRQRRAIENLIEAGIVIQQNRGLPSRRFFRINHERLEYVLSCVKVGMPFM